MLECNAPGPLQSHKYCILLSCPFFLYQVSIPRIKHVLITLNFTSSYKQNKTFSLLNISHINSVLNRLLQLDGHSGVLWTANFYKKSILCFTWCLINCSIDRPLPIAHFGWPILKFWLKQCLCMNQQNNSADMISITKFYTGLELLFWLLSFQFL